VNPAGEVFLTKEFLFFFVRIMNVLKWPRSAFQAYIYAHLSRALCRNRIIIPYFQVPLATSA